MMTFLEYIAVDELLQKEFPKFDLSTKKTSRSETHTLKVDDRVAARDAVAAYFKKNKIKFEIKGSSKSSFDPIFVEKSAIIFKPKKTGSDAKTTAMQERVSAWIFKRVLDDDKKYNTAQDIVEDPKFQKDVMSKGGLYPDVPDDWIEGFFAQQKKMLDEFSNSKFSEFNRDGGFMDWITKLVKEMGVKQKDTWNPADIWLVNGESAVKKEIMAALGKVKIITELNAIMKRLYNERRLVGVSLKKISGKAAKYEEINVNEIFGLSDDYAFRVDFSKSKLDLLTNSEGKFGTQDANVVANSKKAVVKFQIKQNDSSKRSNLKFEPTQKGAAAARLGKVPVDMLATLLNEHNVKFINNNKLYPDNADAFVKVASRYAKKAKAIGLIVKTNIKNDDEFTNSFARAFASSDKKMHFTAISKLMQIDFLFEFLKLKKSSQEEIITDMVFLAMKKGKNFGPHGKLF